MLPFKRRAQERGITTPDAFLQEKGFRNELVKLVRTKVCIDGRGSAENFEGARWYGEFFAEIVEPACDIDKSLARSLGNELEPEESEPIDMTLVPLPGKTFLPLKRKAEERRITTPRALLQDEELQKELVKLVTTLVTIDATSDSENAEGAEWYRDFVTEILEPACEMDEALAKKLNPF